MQSPVYLDYNATTPLHPEVSKCMSEALGKNYFDGFFGNASSTHYYGVQSHTEIEKARTSVSNLVGCSPSEIIFTSCGTESNNMVIFGCCDKYSTLYPSQQIEILTTCIDHPSIKEACHFASKIYKAKIIEIPVDRYGQIDVNFILKNVNENTCLVSIMFANNEIGTLLNVPGAFRSISEKRKTFKNNEFPFLHTDCAQAVGKVPVKVGAIHCDFLSIAGHKFYGPKGVGALYIRKGISIPRVCLQGAGQERGMRPGTENIIGIVGIGKAAEISNREIIERIKIQSEFVKIIYKIFSEKCSDKIEIKINGYLEKCLSVDNEKVFNENVDELCNVLKSSDEDSSVEKAVMKLGCLPGTLSVSFKGVEAMDIVKLISNRVCTSVGSACHSACRQVSAVLSAIGLDESFAFGTFRISVGCGLTKEMVVHAANIISDEILSSISK